LPLWLLLCCWMLPAWSDGADEPGGLSVSERVRVEAVRFEGHSVFDEATLVAIARPFLQRDLAIEDLEDLRDRISRHYTDAGYISSGALIPEQSLADGVLTIRVVEGRLTEIDVHGTRDLSSGYLRHELQQASAGAVNVNALKERMQVLLQERVVEQMNAELKPGDRFGESVLVAAVREPPRYTLDLDVANDRPVSVGETGATLALSLRNLLGYADLWSLAAGATRGYESYSLAGETAVPIGGVRLFFGLGRDEGSVVEDTFRELDITSEQQSAEVGFAIPLQRSLQSQSSLRSALVWTRTTTYLLGQRFSFSPGVMDGESTVSAFRQVLDWTQRGSRQVIAYRAALDLGLDAFGSTVSADDSPDSRFAVLKQQVQYLRRYREGASQWLLRGELQLASDGLLPASKIAVGGSRSVRGYPENSLVRDEGAIFSSEFQQRLAYLRVPGMARQPGDGVLVAAVFLDLGHARDRDRDAEARSLGSVGAGLHWSPLENLEAQVYKGFPFIHEPSGGDSLQDEGIHFRVHYGTRF